jgi:hypothetical protein
MTTSREYEKRRKAETDKAIAEGRDPDDFKRNDEGEILYCVFFEVWLQNRREVMWLIDQHRGENHQVESIDNLTSLYIDLPESEVEPFMTALRKLDFRVENYGRINANGIPEELDYEP